MRLYRIAIAAIALLAAGRAWAADDNPAYTNAKEAGPDFAVQGEYVGTTSELGEKWGAHVIALGDGKFDVVGYKGGLPGDGWKKGDEAKRGTGELKDGVLELKGDDWTATVKEGVFSEWNGHNAL